LRYFTKGDILKVFEPPGGQDCAKLLGSGNEVHTDTLSDSDSVLLRHYIASTSISIAHDKQSEALWQVTVPQLAYLHPFLLHAILACSALHLAYKYPAQQGQYLVEASSHQNIAMPQFRSAIENVDSDNCHSILVFSHLLVIYSFALERQDERLFIVEGNETDVSPSWLHFLRNGCLMVCSVWDLIEDGPVKELASQWEVPIEISEEGKLPLVDHLLSVIPSQDSQYAWSVEECRLYTNTAIELGQAFACTRTLDEKFTTWDALRIWPMLISLGFMNLLNNWHPGALILLCHYCILLKKLEAHWYFEGRATRLLTTIFKHLDTRWHCFVKWPLEEIGISSPVF
jgi:hypothetical protein